jgi:hypothetical protein
MPEPCDPVVVSGASPEDEQFLRGFQDWRRRHRPTPERITCPCCGHRTLPDGPGAYEVCPVCGWEDDGVSTKHPTLYDGGPNGVSLAEAQRRHRLYGPDRPPRADEPLDADWQPYAPLEAEDPHRPYLRDLGWLLFQRAAEARDEVRRNDNASNHGRLKGLTEAIELLLTQAALFDLSRDDLGLPDGDLRDELSPEPPPGDRFAG